MNSFPNILLLFAALCLSLFDINCSPGGVVFADGKGVAIRGYDTVAYFTAAKPTPGDARYTHSYQGATWRFASERNRALFAKNPERYVPRYGGFCAYAVANGYRASIDPAAWKITGGKLYLNYDADVQKKWEADQESMIQNADRNWVKLLAEEKAKAAGE